MRSEKFEFTVPTEDGVSDTFNTFRFEGKTVQIYGTFDAEISLEGSVNGTDFDPISGLQVSPVILLIQETITLLRIRVRNFVDGAPLATFAGFDSRST